MLLALKFCDVVVSIVLKDFNTNNIYTLFQKKESINCSLSILVNPITD